VIGSSCPSVRESPIRQFQPLQLGLPYLHDCKMQCDWNHYNGSPVVISNISSTFPLTLCSQNSEPDRRIKALQQNSNRGTYITVRPQLLSLPYSWIGALFGLSVERGSLAFGRRISCEPSGPTTRCCKENKSTSSHPGLGLSVDKLSLP